MPIRNVGTFLENLVVVEVALSLLERCRSDGAPLDFINSFAMPPLTPWCWHSQQSGFDAGTLERVIEETEPTSLQGYAGLLRANLRKDKNRGPNAALLLAGASLQKGVHCRMWLNDIRDGHYGDAIPELEQIESCAQNVYGSDAAGKGRLTVRVSDVAYPGSIEKLADVLRDSQPCARLAFLDPMGYRIRRPRPYQTSSSDHRRWLTELAFDGLTCAAHFTGNSRQPTLCRELHSLHQDAVYAGYAVSRAFKRQHYVLFLAVHSPREEEAERVASEIEVAIQSAWVRWGNDFARRGRRDWMLKIYRGGRDGIELVE